MYSKEENTPASKLPNQVHHATKKSRYNKLMKRQQEISNEVLKQNIGKTYEVIIENISFDGKYLIGRTAKDVPEEDGVVYIQNTESLNEKELMNTFIKVKIIDINDYDLIGEIV